MQQLAHMAGVVVHSELLLNHPRDHGRGPDSGVQAIGHRAAVQDVLQGLLVRATQLRRSSAALSFQQTFDAMGFITCQPLGNLGAWGLQNRRQLPAAAPLRIQHYCLQPLGHAIGSVSFRLFAQTNQPLIGAGVQTNHSRKHGTPPKASMPSFFCYVPLLMRICISPVVSLPGSPFLLPRVEWSQRSLHVKSEVKLCDSSFSALGSSVEARASVQVATADSTSAKSWSFAALGLDDQEIASSNPPRLCDRWRTKRRPARPRMSPQLSTFANRCNP